MCFFCHENDGARHCPRIAFGESEVPEVSVAPSTVFVASHEGKILERVQ